MRILLAASLLLLCVLGGLVTGGFAYLLPHRLVAANMQTPGARSQIIPTPPLVSILAQDDFHRPDQTFWGMASDGQTWGGDANTLEVFSVSNGAGQISGRTGTYNAVLGPIGTDMDATASGVVNRFTGSANLGVVVHWSDPNHWYKAFVDGTRLVLLKRINATSVELASVPFIAAGNQAYSIRLQAVGSMLRARAWPSDTLEPVAWLIEAHDTALSSGLAGIRVVLAPTVVMRIFFFQATRLA